MLSLSGLSYGPDRSNDESNFSFKSHWVSPLFNLDLKYQISFIVSISLSRVPAVCEQQTAGTK
jgi:hypothetical protein